MNISYKFILFAILISFQYSFGQFYQKKQVLNNENFDKPPLSWGYFLGFNSYDFNFDYVNNRSDIQTEKSTGFNVGLIGNIRINDYFDFRFEPYSNEPKLGKTGQI